ncbi:hypothetical protein ACJX0J_005859, partial [Zea mays]
RIIDAYLISGRYRKRSLNVGMGSQPYFLFLNDQLRDMFSGLPMGWANYTNGSTILSQQELDLKRRNKNGTKGQSLDENRRDVNLSITIQQYLPICLLNGSTCLRTISDREFFRTLPHVQHDPLILIFERGFWNLGHSLPYNGSDRIRTGLKFTCYLNLKYYISIVTYITFSMVLEFFVFGYNMLWYSLILREPD